MLLDSNVIFFLQCSAWRKAAGFPGEHIGLGPIPVQFPTRSWDGDCAGLPHRCSVKVTGSGWVRNVISVWYGLPWCVNPLLYHHWIVWDSPSVAVLNLQGWGQSVALWERILLWHLLLCEVLQGLLLCPMLFNNCMCSLAQLVRVSG